MIIKLQNHIKILNYKIKKNIKLQSTINENYEIMEI